MSDFDLYGVFVPSFLIQAILAYFVFVLMSYLTDRLDMQGWTGLFKLCLYLVCLLLVHQVFVEINR